MKKRSILPLIAAVLTGAGVGSAAELFVDRGHPEAGDRNPGTEANPFKTIQPAVNAAQPGDTIWVKAGFYRDPVAIRTRGARLNRITLAAWKNDRVLVGSEPYPLPAQDAWKRVPGAKSWQVTLPESTPAGELVLLFDGKPQPCQLTNTPPRDDQVLWGTYRVSDRMLTVNAGGPNPAEKYRLELAQHIEGLIGLKNESAHWTVRGFEFANACNFMENFGYDNVIEDCYFRHAYRRAIFGSGYISVVRRCTFDDSALHGAAGSASVFEDNIFYRGDRPWDEDIHHRVMDYREGSGGIMFKGTGMAMTFRYNFCDDIGFWPDGNGTGTRLYGNAFHDHHGYAIYNEAADDDTLIIGNYMGHTQAGVSSSWCSRMSVIDNFIEGPGYGVVMHNRDKWQLRDSFMVIRGNAIVGSPLPLSGYGGGYDNAPEGWSNCLVDFNHYRLKSGAGTMMLDLDGKTRCRTIEEMRQTLGWDLHGEAGPYDPEQNDLTPESLGGGTVTVRTPIGENSWKSRAMLSDPAINGKWPAVPRFLHTTLPSFFWRVADGDFDDQILLGHGREYRYEDTWWPDSSAGYGEGEVMGCAWYVGADPISGQPGLTWSTLLDVTRGNRFLAVSGKTPGQMLPQGVGWWTPSLPTISGAVVDVSLRIRGAQLEPAGENGGPAVWMQFTSLTGQQRTRVFVVGRDDSGRVQNAELVKGSYDWREIRQSITAPATAGRMALFLGLRPAGGTVHFDDINIKTRPGAMPESAAKKDAPPPRLPLERFRETFFVDLAPFVNRSFADDEANNGKGGWSDQGPNCDMREFATGLRKFGGVPFNILPDTSLVVLKSAWRHAGNLPDQVVIPVDRPADTLFFLHAEAWGGGEDDFRYIIRYVDGKDVTLTVGRKNNPGWSRRPTSDFPAEEGTQTVVAETVPSPQFGQGSMYRMEWNSPADRRGIKIMNIEFAGSPGAIPILAGITGVLEW